MRTYFPLNEEAVSHIWLFNWSILNFLIYEENFIFFFISVQHASRNGSASQQKERTWSGSNRSEQDCGRGAWGRAAVDRRSGSGNHGETKAAAAAADGLTEDPSRTDGIATVETAVTASGAVSIWKLLATTNDQRGGYRSGSGSGGYGGRGGRTRNPYKDAPGL
jgi:hypothetical protein